MSAGGVGWKLPLHEAAVVHEYSLVLSLMERVREAARERGAVRVHRIEVRLGELSGVDPELFRSAFEMCREGSSCNGAELALQTAGARWSCASCGREVIRGEPLWCVDCDRPARLETGDEILLERIEMEVA